MGAECVQNVRARELGRGNNIVYTQKTRGVSCKLPGSSLPQVSTIEDREPSVERSISYMKRVESKSFKLGFSIVTIYCSYRLV